MTVETAEEPLVSCLMVTLPVRYRLPFFRQSVADYCRQTHARRELVIVTDQGEPAARAELVAHVASLGRDDIRIVDVPGKHTLGALRNASVANARGELLCLWDDDDRFHPDRIATQASILRAQRPAALCLEDAFQYFPAARTLHLVSFRATRERVLPGSLMMRRDAAPRYPEEGPTSLRGEDSAGLRQIRAHGGIGVVTGIPHLYVYVSHGENTWGAGHHRMIADRLSIPCARILQREASLREGLAAYDLGAGEVAVRGYEGVAFTLNAPGGASSRATDTRSS